MLAPTQPPRFNRLYALLGVNGVSDVVTCPATARNGER